MEAGPPAPLSPADLRSRRQHPAERRLSFRSGSLLLLMIAQAAFGYALVDAGRAEWVRWVHFGLAWVVLLLFVRLDLTTWALPFPGARRTALRVMGGTLTWTASLQMILGLALRGWIPLPLRDLRTYHIGLGLLLTFVVLALHMTSIWPSIRLGARKEWEASFAAPRDLDRKV